MNSINYDDGHWKSEIYGYLGLKACKKYISSYRVKTPWRVDVSRQKVKILGRVNAQEKTMAPLWFRHSANTVTSQN